MSDTDDAVRPHSEKRIRGGVFSVGGTRRLLLGAELHNSSASTRDQIARSFERVRALGATCVLAPVSWELLEPDEGRFDFDLVDEMVTRARSIRLGLIPLWFGSWKNGVSSYAPGFVKADAHRFPRAHTGEGPVETLSPFAPANRDADTAAFARLTAHLRDIDAFDVVQMIQVENEVGLLGGVRDLGPSACDAWDDIVPTGVVDVVRARPEMPVHRAWRAVGCPEGGTWSEVFGTSPAAQEAFMATAYATYVQHVAAAGKAQFDVPMFVNAWLEKVTDYDLTRVDEPPAVAVTGGREPGMYPSGGPVRAVVPLWRALAPAVDACAPDIYAAAFDTIAADYRRLSDVLLIPEMQRGLKGVANMFRAVGEHDAVLVSPFGADSFADDAESAPLRDGYRLLAAVADTLARHPDARTRGFMLTEDDRVATTTLGELDLCVTTTDPLGLSAAMYPAYAVLVEEAPGVILAVARGCSVTAQSWAGHRVGIRTATELGRDDREWHTTRVLNGDETGSGSAVRFPHLHRMASVSPIPTWHDATGIVRIEYYRTQATV